MKPFAVPAAADRRGSLIHRGFTLIELMITMAIAAMLISIAIPAYTKQVQKSRRTDIKTALVDLASREERFLSINNRYSAVPSELGYQVPGDAWPAPIGGGYYKITSIVVTAAAANAPATFLISAAANGSQTADTACLNYSLDYRGNQGATNVSTCWG